MNSRAKKAKTILDKYYEKGEDAQNVRDVIADLLHFSDARGVDYAMEEKKSRDHYLEEIYEEHFRDWYLEVRNGDTRLGFDEWRLHKREEQSHG